MRLANLKSFSEARPRGGGRRLETAVIKNPGRKPGKENPMFETLRFDTAGKRGKKRKGGRHKGGRK